MIATNPLTRIMTALADLDTDTPMKWAVGYQDGRKRKRG